MEASYNMRILLIEGDPVATKRVEGVLAHANLEVVKTSPKAVSPDRESTQGYDVVLDVGFEADDAKHDARPKRSGPADVAWLHPDRSGAADTGQKASAQDRPAVEFGALELVETAHTLSDDAKATSGRVFHIGKLCVDTQARLAKVDGTTVKLTEMEYQVLELLCRNKDQPVTKDAFMRHFYAGQNQPKPKIIDVFVCKLRGKLKKALGGVNYIETIWGKGYVLSDPDANRQVEYSR